MTDYIGYQALSQAAMRGVMREALKIAASDQGLPGDHHFYITFRTKAPGVQVADHLVTRFPEEMTIVVQHQFWDLEIGDEHFEIILKFAGVPQHLKVPYTAVSRFVDPSVNFGLGFEPVAGENDDVVGPVATPETANGSDGDSELSEAIEASNEMSEAPAESRPASDGTVVSLDAFRRK